MTNEEYNQVELEQQEQEEMKMVYCDYIADRIRKDLLDAATNDTILEIVSGVKHDAVQAMMFSSTKTIWTIDANGQSYKITVEEV